MRLVFDLETDGHLNELTKIHCIATRNADDPSQSWVFGPQWIEQGIKQLEQASEIIGHNIVCFDIPAIRKTHPHFDIDGVKVTDTLVLSRLMRSDLKNDDYALGMTIAQFPKRMLGSHSLKAWGLRLGVHKGDFGEQTDWSEWSQGMQDYCEQDVEVNLKLWEALAPHTYSQQAIEFEHRIAELCHRIGQAGWTFDTSTAAELFAELSAEKTALEDELQTLFPNWEVGEEFIPKVNNKKLGYVKGEPFMKRKEVVFNPNSRKHIEFCLRQKYDWKPTKFTLQGDAQINEATLGTLPYPEAQKLARSFMLQKRLGQLADGKNGWMRLVDDDGKLRHTINPNGTVTGRASSFGPNLQQVPGGRSEYGNEFRQLFQPQQGYQLVGADLKGLELRCLAGFLQDGGAYGKEVVEGDIHQKVADQLGISRDNAKTFQYALCYGGGNARLGSILGKGPREGQALRDRFYRANPAFKLLLKAVKAAVDKRGYLIGLDGRHLPVRTDYGAVNTLLQSAGALLAKKWIELIDLELNSQQLDATIIAWVHDEVQIETKGDPDNVGNITRRMAQEAGRAFNFSVPIDADFGVGRNWSETH